MGLLTLTQIPCHHVLSNEIALNLQYRIGIKHFFNINLGLGIMKKTKLLFLFVFSTYLLVFFLKFRSGELIGCRIKFCIQRVPTWHTFDGPCYPKTRNTWKNVMMTSSHFFSFFLFLGSRVHQKYAVWALVGCRNKFHIQWSLSLEMWVKIVGDMLKITRIGMSIFCLKYGNNIFDLI